MRINNIIEHSKFKFTLSHIFYIASRLLVLVSVPFPTQALQIGINTYYQTVELAYGANPTIVDGGIVRIHDNYPEINSFRISDVGDTAGRYHRDSSLFNVTLKGYQHGHTITLRGKLGDTRFRNPSTATGSFEDSRGTNQGCSTVLPFDPIAIRGEVDFRFNPINSDMTQDCRGYSADYRYENIRPMQGNRREVFFDLPGLLNSEAYQQLPPDLYFADVNLILERWIARVGGQQGFNLPLTIRIRKQAYFSGISLPSTTLALTVTYIGQTVQGRAATPIILQGAFDPNFGRVRLNARSDNTFSLRNGDQAVPYQADVIVNQQRFALNSGNTANPVITINNLNDVRQIPLTLEVNVNQPRSQINRSGRYSDRLTLIAEVPLV